ncbi:flippase-like domain-containing protein [bacterium]|nr:flippase-like domain-containing protein [bacterium]
MKNFLKIALALAISLTCLWFAFRNVDYNQAMQIFSHGRVRIIPLSVFTCLCLAVMWVRSWRWTYLFRPEHKATVGGLTVANLIGFMTNNILPLRIGEMVRAWMARRKSRAPLSYVIGSLVVERLFDTLCMLLCLIVPLLFIPGLPGVMRKIGLGMTAAFFGALGIMLLLRFKPHLAQTVIAVPARRFMSAQAFAKLDHLLHTFTDGLRMLKDGGAMLKVATLSVFHWGLVVFSYYMAFQGFSFDSLPWTAPFLTLGLVGLGVALPSAPAFIGPLHTAIIYSLSDIYGVPKSEAIGFAVVMHLLMMLPLTAVGLALMSREGLSLSQIRQSAEQTAETSAEPTETGPLPAADASE